MSKVLVDRELLDSAATWLEVHAPGGGCVEGSVAEDLRAILEQPAEAEGTGALDELLALFPLKIDKQAFVINGGAPLTADGDDEFLSFKKVDAALGEIRLLAEQGRAALSAVTAERDLAVQGGLQIIAERDRLRDAAGKAIAWLDAEQNESGLGIYRRIKLCRDAENSLRAAVATQAGEL